MPVSERPVVAWRDITGDIVAHKRKGVEPSMTMECGLQCPSFGPSGLNNSDYILQSGDVATAKEWVVQALGDQVAFRHCYACWDAMPA